MTRDFNGEYSVQYRELVYSIWYTNNRPGINTLADLIPDDDNRAKPNANTLALWRSKYNWDDRANTADIEISERTDRELIEIRIEMMKRHAQQAKEIAQKAYEFIVSDDFDSSASAVSAWVKAVEEEKKSTGMANSLTQIYSMSDDELKKKFDQLLGRTTNVGEVVVSKLNDEEVVDAFSTEETPDE